MDYHSAVERAMTAIMQPNKKAYFHFTSLSGHTNIRLSMGLQYSADGSSTYSQPQPGTVPVIACTLCTWDEYDEAKIKAKTQNLFGQMDHWIIFPPNGMQQELLQPALALIKRYSTSYRLESVEIGKYGQPLFQNDVFKVLTSSRDQEAIAAVQRARFVGRIRQHEEGEADLKDYAGRGPLLQNMVPDIYRGVKRRLGFM